MKMRMLQLAAALLGAFPLLAAGQQPTRPRPRQNQSAMTCPMGMHGMMMGPMGDSMMRGGQREMGGVKGGQMGAMMNDSAMMVQMRSQLALTDAQVQQLRAIHQRACAAAQPHMTMAMQAHQTAMKLLTGDNPNLNAFEGQLDNGAKHMVKAQVEMAKGMIEFRKALTPAQRQKLDQMHQQMMQGGMRPG
jgi:Spy/CpxP family protein refolding chaperone